MTRTATWKHRSIGQRIRDFGEQLRDLMFVRRFWRRQGPDMRLNDGWSQRDLERLAQEYGDGGDCWWAGCGR